MIGKSVLFSKASDEWRTPSSLIDYLSNTFIIIYDLAAISENTLTEKYCPNLCESTIHDVRKEIMNLLHAPGEVAFCNPPYSQCREFVCLCVGMNVPIIMLLPARTDTRWFHDYLYKKENIVIEFLRGRLRFSNAKHNAPFPSMLAYINIFKAKT